MQPVVESIASAVSHVTVEGMNRARYNTTSSNVLSALRSVLDQSTFMMSQHVLPAKSGVPIPVFTSVDAQDKDDNGQGEINRDTQEENSDTQEEHSAAIDTVNERPVTVNEVNLVDPVTVHHHAQNAKFRRHKDMADVVLPPKKQKHRPTEE